MLDIFIKLIEKSIQLIEERKKQKKSMLEDFVDPIYSEFLTVHEKYISSFKEYMNDIKSQDNKPDLLQNLCLKLYEENLFTEHQRTSLNIFCNALDEIQEHDEVSIFLGDVRSYITNQLWNSYSDSDDITRLNRSFRSQIWRNSLKGDLEKIVDIPEKYSGQHQAEAIHKLNIVVIKMQKHASRVTSSYLNAKVKLLEK